MLFDKIFFPKKILKKWVCFIVCFFLFSFRIFLQENSLSELSELHEISATQDDQFGSQKMSIDNVDEKNIDEKLSVVTGLPRAHFFKGGVSVIAADKNASFFFVAGNDGMISRFSYPLLKAETWQISNFPIKNMAVHPKKPYLLLYETDEFNIHRISVFDWQAKKTVFAKRFTSTVVSLSWSAQGNYIFVGHTSTKGVTVMDSAGRVLNIFDNPPGVVMFAMTGPSEKTLISYGQSGRLVYTDLQRKRPPIQYSTEANLQQAHLIRKNTEIVGVRDNTVFIINALSGQITDEYRAHGSVLFANQVQDSVPVWIEPAQNCYSWRLRRGNDVSAVFTAPDRVELTAALYLQSHILIGTNIGLVYVLEEKNNGIQLTCINDSHFVAVSDVVADAAHVFALLRQNVYAFSDPNSPAEKILSSVHGNRLHMMENGFLIWSDEKAAPVYYYSLIDKSQKIIYRPKERISFVSHYNHNILFIELFSGLTVLSFSEEKNVREIFNYVAAGLQSAVQIDDETIFVTRSVDRLTYNPIFSINLYTKETLPLALEGDFAFELGKNKIKNDFLYCFLVQLMGEVKKTSVVCIVPNMQEPLKTRFYPILSYDDEDLRAFLLSDDMFVLTNLGKQEMIMYDMQTRKISTLTRDYVLPILAKSTKHYIVSLNSDGSLTWYNKHTGKLIKTVSFD